MNTPPEGDGPAGFTYEELADLQSGLLSTAEERDLRARIEQAPDAAARMLDDLAAVDRAFPDPSNVNDPLEVPPHVAARWQAAIAREAERRAQDSSESGSDTTSSEAADSDDEAAHPPELPPPEQ